MTSTDGIGMSDYHSPFSHLRLCLEPSLPFRRASRRSRLSRRRILRVVVVVGLWSKGTESLTVVPRVNFGEDSDAVGMAAAPVLTVLSSFIGVSEIGGSMTGTMCDAMIARCVVASLEST